MRLKILLIILGALVVIFVIYVVFFRPSMEASSIHYGRTPYSRPTKAYTPRRTPLPTFTPIFSPTPVQTPLNTVFSDDFSGTLSKWQQIYNGYGTIAVENGELSMAPQAATTPSVTHAPLVVSNSPVLADYTLIARMKTVQQLRTGSQPNPWEVGWLLFRVGATSPSFTQFYYFIHKTNGLELGMVNGSRQTIFATADTPTLSLNTWNTYKVVVKGPNMKVYVNGVLGIEYTDPAATFLTGKVGLYNEDAHVQYDDVNVVQN